MARSTYCVAGFVVYLVTMVVFLVSFGSPFWEWWDDIGYGVELSSGLWQGCHKGIIGTDWSCTHVEWTSNTAEWFKWTEVLMTGALLVLVIAGGLHMYVPVTAALQIIGGVLTGIAAAVYGTEIGKATDDAGISNPLHWAFGLACIAAIIFLINGITLAANSHGDMKMQWPCQGANAPPQQVPMVMSTTTTIPMVISGVMPPYYAPPPGVAYQVQAPTQPLPPPAYNYLPGK